MNIFVEHGHTRHLGGLFGRLLLANFHLIKALKISQEKKINPTIKPFEVFQDILPLCPNSTDMVIDQFCHQVHHE